MCNTTISNLQKPKCFRNKKNEIFGGDAQPNISPWQSSKIFAILGLYCQINYFLNSIVSGLHVEKRNVKIDLLFTPEHKSLQHIMSFLHSTYAS